jgi:hypothetical protein
VDSNAAANNAGAVYALDCGDLTIDRCTFAYNSTAGTETAGGIHLEGTTSLTMTNTIMSSQWGYDIAFLGSSAEVSYSDFDDWAPYTSPFSGTVPAGLGELIQTNANNDSCDISFNIYLDPLFEDPTTGNYQITWFNFPNWDETRSPCIDAGDPLSAFDPDTTTADIGALYFDQNVPGTLPEIAAQLPNAFHVAAPYPNPFNPTTTFTFKLPAANRVTLDVFDASGRNIGSRLLNGPTEDWYSAGTHQIVFNGTGLPSGTYIYRIKAGKYTASGKMVLIK